MSNKKLSIIVPARHELYLQQTIDDLFAKAAGDIEIIVVLDNYWPVPIIADHPGLTIVHWGGRRGMRAAINAGAEIGKGEYLLKVDAHIIFSQGYDVELQKDCDSDWVVIPRRYSLVAEEWRVREDKPPIDYEYLGYPYDENGNELGVHARYYWGERTRARKDYLIDEDMAFQGSCYFLHMDYFRKLIYPMDDVNYGMFIGEPAEVGFKTWLSGGKNMVNKKVWYAHLHKGEGYRKLHQERMGFPYTRVGMSELIRGNKFSTDFWWNNKWEQRTHDIEWLIERFWPLPGWPENWRELKERGIKSTK